MGAADGYARDRTGGGLGKPLDEVLADFDVLKGGLFPILLAVELLSPLVAAKLRHLR